MDKKTKPEVLADADLDDVKGGYWSGAVSKNPFTATKPDADKQLRSARDGAERYIGETEKNVVGEGGGSDI